MVSVGVLALVFASEPQATPPLPVATPPASAPAPREGEPEILFINFEGAVLQSGCGNDAHYDCSTLADLFDGYVGPFTGNLNQKMAILQATRKALADFGVRVVTERPPEDVDYTMVLYGDLGPQSFAGVAPYIDCEDLIPNDTSFAQAFSGANTGSTVILQEAAHTWGLEHVDSEFDVLNPFKAAGKSQRFTDECFEIVANTELERTPGACNQVHTRFCEAGAQNSYREMLHLFGPAVPDVNPPTLEITYPANGSTFVLPTSFALEGELSDELHPQFYRIEIWDDDVLLRESTDVRVQLLVSDPPPGDYELRVVVADEAGNETEDTVTFTILPEGSELPETEATATSSDDSAAASDDSAGCSIAPWSALPLWLLLGLQRRRSLRVRPS